MSVLRRRRVEPAEQRFSVDEWLRLANPPTASGVSVTVESALRSSAVSACQRVLVASTAYLTPHALRQQGRRKVNLTPAPLIVERPSNRVTRRNWVAQVCRSLVSDGNAYIRLGGFDRSDWPNTAEVLPLADCRWLKVGGVERLHVAGSAVDLWPNGDVLHIPASAFMQPGASRAASPTDLARESIGTGIAAERYGASFFGGGGHPSAIISSEVDLSPDEAKAIKAAFRSALNGQEPAVFGAGLTYTPVQANPSDTQFLDLMRFEVEQACRFFGVPPTMVYAAISGQNVTYSNATQQDLHFLKYSLGIWLADIEDAWTSLLPRPVEVKFNVDALLRMDPAARWVTHEVATRIGARTINEVREYEDEDPFDGEQYDRPPGSDEGRQLSAVEAVQKLYLGVGTVITSDEARSMVNALGGDLDVPGPDFAQLTLPV